MTLSTRRLESIRRGVRALLSRLPDGLRWPLWRLLFRLRVRGRVALASSVPPVRMDDRTLATWIRHYANGVWRCHRGDTLALERLETHLAEWDRRGRARGDAPAWPDVEWARRVLRGEPLDEVMPTPTENIWEAIRLRRSYRRFRAGDVPAEAIERILEAGAWAPTACNRQPWRFVVEGNGPVRVHVVIDERPYFEREAAAMDAAAITQNMLLAATALGLASLWINSGEIEDQARLRARFGLEAHERVHVMIVIGRAGAPTSTPVRKPLAPHVLRPGTAPPPDEDLPVG